MYLSSKKGHKRKSTAFDFITLTFTLLLVLYVFCTVAEMPLNWFKRKLVSFQHTDTDRASGKKNRCVCGTTLTSPPERQTL